MNVFGLGQLGGFFNPFDEMYIAREWPAGSCSLHSHPEQGNGSRLKVLRCALVEPSILPEMWLKCLRRAIGQKTVNHQGHEGPPRNAGTRAFVILRVLGGSCIFQTATTSKKLQSLVLGSRQIRQRVPPVKFRCVLPRRLASFPQQPHRSAASNQETICPNHSLE